LLGCAWITEDRMMTRRRIPVGLLIASLLMGAMLCLVGCNDGNSSGEDDDEAPEQTSGDETGPEEDPGRPTGDAADAADEKSDEDEEGSPPAPRPIVAYGDSITAGSAIPTVRPYPARLSIEINETVINAGIPGQSACRAVSELNRVIRHNPKIVLFLLGTNDVIGGHDLDNSRECLRSMIRSVKGIGARPILATIPPMNGEMATYMTNVNYLNGLIRALSQEESVTLVDVAAEFGTGQWLLLADGYHPNETGTQVIAFAFAKSF